MVMKSILEIENEIASYTYKIVELKEQLEKRRNFVLMKLEQEKEITIKLSPVAIEMSGWETITRNEWIDLFDFYN